MACKYWYEGKWHTEAKFKEILANGLLDKLIAENKVSLSALESTSGKTQDFNAEEGKKTSIVLRILHKIQSKLNNEVAPGTGEFVNNNPIDVLAKANEERKALNPKAKDIPLRLAIKVNGTLRVGEGKANAALKAELEKSAVFNTMVDNMKEGIPYMLIPSAYGLYPVQVRSSKIKESKKAPVVASELLKLSKASGPVAINAIRKNIEKLLYRTTVEFINGKFVVNQYNADTAKIVKHEFANVEETSNFLGELLYRVDYNSINKGNYNTAMAQDGAFTTDLFSENGNFFNSSSFVVEAYSTSNEAKATFDSIFTSTLPASSTESAEASMAANASPVSNNSTSKADENPMFSEPVDTLTAALKEDFYVDIPVTGSNYGYVRVSAAVVDNKISVIKAQRINRITQKNKSDVIKEGPILGTGVELNNITKEFFAHPVVGKKQLEILNNLNKNISLEGIEAPEMLGADNATPIKKASRRAAMLDANAETPTIESANEWLQQAASTETVPEDVTPENLTSDDLDFFSDFDNGIEGETPTTKLRATEKEDATTWDKEQELTWLMDKVTGTSNWFKTGTFDSLEELEAYLPKETYEMLLEARKSGKTVHGLFTKAAMYLWNNAAAGTTYHEAFHIVFNLALPLSARLEILTNAVEVYSEDLSLNSTFLEIEEYLADKFMEYTQAEEAGEKTTSKKINNFFKGLYRMLKTFFNSKRKVDVEKLFEDINLGVYKHSIKFKNTNIPGQAKLRAEDRRFDNPMEERASFQYLSNRLTNIIEEYKTKNSDFLDKNDQEVLNAIGIQKMYSALITQLAGDINANSNQEIKAKLLNLFNVATNNKTAIQKVIIDEKPVIVFKEIPDFIQRFNNSLKNRGLHIGLKTVKAITNNIEEENPFDTKEENTQEEAWMIGNIEINPKESISVKLRSFFATIPKYLSNQVNARKAVNEFGVQGTEDSNKVFAYLISKISNSYSVEDMMAKLRKIKTQRPYINHIIEKVELDKGLRTDLFTAIASKNFATFTAVYEKNGEYRIINSNRKTLENIIQEEIISKFLTQGNPLFNKDKNGQTDFTNIKQEAVTLYLKGIEDSIGVANKISNKQDIDNFLDNLSKKLKAIKLSITTEDLNTIWNPESGKASWGNIQALLTQLQKLGLELQKGNNPFLFLQPDDVIASSKIGDRNVVEAIAKIVQPALEKETVSSFRNIEGKTVYNLILSGFLNKQIAKFKDDAELQKYLEEISGDPLLRNLPFIQDLKNPEGTLQDKLSVVILDGLSRSGKNQAQGYSDMSPIELTTTELAMFYNNGSSKTARFKMPIPSNSPTLPFLTAESFTNDEVVDRLVQTAKAEYSRILNLKNSPKDSLLRLIPNYNKLGLKFQHLPFLNKLDLEKGFDEALVKSTIEDYLKNTFLAKELAYYKKEGIIKSYTNDKIVFADKVIDGRIKNKEEFFANYLYNSFYMNMQMTSLFGGDPAFYKNTTDYQKRYKQILSPGTYPNTEGLSATYNMVVLEDEVAPTDEKTVDSIKKIIEQSNLTAEEKLTLSTLWGTVFSNPASKDFEGHNLTDGATFISVHRKKQQLEGLNKWTPAHEEAYQRELRGEKPTEKDLDMFKPEKPFYFGFRTVEGVSVPTQVKNSEVTLTHTLALQKNADGTFMYPKLAAMYQDLMNPEKGIDAFAFASAIKDGAVGANVNAKGNVEFADYVQQSDGSYTLTNGQNIMAMQAADWRLQQETPAHYIDDRSNFSSQLRNLIIGDMDMQGDYNINGTKLKGSEVVSLYQDLIIEDLRSSFEDVREMFETPTGEIDFIKLATELRAEAIKKDMNQDFLDALSIYTDNVTGKSSTVLPLYHPMISYKIESLMNSFFTNRVTKQKITGGSLVNASSYGTSNNLSLVVNEETGAITMQAMLPAWSKKLFPKDSNGEVNIEFIKKHAPELLNIIGYRIPNEDKYSMFNIEVVGFTPSSMGPIVILPIEITTIAGLDFDIDKTYFMSRAFTVDKKGVPSYTKYIEELDTEEKVKQAALQIYSNFADFKRFVKNNVQPSNVDKMLEGYRNLMDRLIENPENMAMADATAKEVITSIKELKSNIGFAIKTYGKDSSVVRGMYETIDELYKSLNEDFIRFNNTLVETTEADLKVLEFIENKLKTNFDPLKFNSRLARDNKKIELIQGILENKNTAASILNPGSFDNLKMQAARIRLLQAGKIAESKLPKNELLAAADALDNEDFGINLPSTQLELFKRNMMGSKLIGIFANHNVHHAKSQYTNLRLKESIQFNGKFYDKLNQVYNELGQRISKLLASNLAGVVDNAKYPLSSFLNSNTYTVNTIALLERLGLDEDTVYAFVNQPVILELTQLYFNEKGSLSEDKQFDAIRNSWRQKLTAKLEEAGVSEDTILDDNLTLEELQKALPGAPKGSGAEVDYYKLQYKVLNLFQKYYEIGQELSEGTIAAKTDTVGVGPTSSANYVFLNKQERVLERIAKNNNKIIGLDEVFKGGTNQKMIPAFTKYALYGPIAVLNKIFPSIGNITPSGTITYSSLGNLKNWFSSQKGENSLTEKEANLINIQYMDFLISAFPLFSRKNSEKILNTVPDKLTEFKNNMSPEAPYKMFIDSLFVVKPDNNSPITRIQYYNTGKTNDDVAGIKASWQRMLEDTNLDVREFALQLVQYTYFSSGYGFGPFTFSNLIPVKFWSNEYQIENNIVDNKNRPFNMFLEDALKADFSEGSVYRNRFIKQFVQNNAEKESLVKSVKIGKSLKKADEGTTGAEQNNVTTILAQKNGIIQTSAGNLVINVSKNRNLFPFGEKLSPIKYIKVYQKSGKVQLYEHRPTKYDYKNPDEFDGQKFIDTVTYFPIDTLGSSNVALEYDFTNDITKSSISKTKAPVKQTTAAKIVATDAQSSVEDAAIRMEQENAANFLAASATAEPVIEGATPKRRRAGTIDTTAEDVPVTYKAYQEAKGTLSEEDFLSLSPREQERRIKELLGC